MTTHEEIARWQHTLDQAIIPFENMYPMWGKPERLPHTQAVEVVVAAVTHPVIELWATSPPVAGSTLRDLVEPVITAASALNTADLRVRPIKRMIGLAKKAKERMATGLPDTETADEVVDEMELELKVLIIAARVGHLGIMQTINTRWGERLESARIGRPVGALPKYVDVLRLEGAEMQSPTTVSFPELLAAAHPGVAATQEYVQQHQVETETEMQRRFAGMWVVTFFTEWELNYRKRLAALHRCPERAVTSTLMRDLGYMRNDFAHNRGIASSKQKRCKRLAWFQPGEPMQPMQRHYEQLLDEFAKEREAFTRAPKPYSSNRVELKGHLPQDLVDRFSAALGTHGVGQDEALESALSAWVEANE